MLLQNVKKVFADFPAAIMDVVSSTDPSTVTQHGLYMRPLQGTTPEQGWGKGRISLLGDAAHATIPNGKTTWPYWVAIVMIAMTASKYSPLSRVGVRAGLVY